MKLDTLNYTKEAIMSLKNYTLNSFLKNDSQNCFDNFIMSYSYPPNHPGYPYGSHQYAGWSGPSQRGAGLPPPVNQPQPYPPGYQPPMNLLMQQQHNYFNSNFNMVPPPLDNFGARSYYQKRGVLLPKPHPGQQVPQLPFKKKKKAEVIIDLEADTPPKVPETIVISDSQQEVVEEKPTLPTKQFIEPTPQPQPKVTKQQQNQSAKQKFFESRKKPQIKIGLQKQTKQKVLGPYNYRHKKQHLRKEQHSAQDPQRKQKKTKTYKRKAITHERYAYRLKTAEKQLMELSDCRQFFPGEIMVGPQFQTDVSRFSLNSGCRKWLQEKRNNLLLRHYE